MNKKPLLILITLFLVLVVIANINSVGVKCNTITQYNEPFNSTAFVNNWCEYYYITHFAWYHTTGYNYVYYGFATNSAWQDILNQTFINNYNSSATFPIIYSVCFNFSVPQDGVSYDNFVFGLCNTSNNQDSLFPQNSGTYCNILGLDFLVNSYTGNIYLDYGNGSTYTQLNTTSYSAGSWKTANITITETSYNTFSCVVYYNNVLFYNDTLTINFNGYVLPFFGHGANTGSSGAINFEINYCNYSINAPPSTSIIDNETVRFFCGYNESIINSEWLSFSVTVENIIDGIQIGLSSFYTLINNIRITLECGLITGIGYVYLQINIIYQYIASVMIVIFSEQTTTPPVGNDFSYYVMGALPTVLILLIPSIIFSTIDRRFVMPMFDVMGMICFIGGLINIVAIIFIFIASIPIILEDG
jgi:hypothetical protein